MDAMWRALGTLILLLAVAAGKEKLQRVLSEKELIREEIKYMKLPKARDKLKAELERLREHAAMVHEPAADVAEAAAILSGAAGGNKPSGARETDVAVQLVRRVEASAAAELAEFLAEAAPGAGADAVRDELRAAA